MSVLDTHGKTVYGKRAGDFEKRWLGERDIHL
jgi:hypothetical protein